MIGRWTVGDPLLKLICLVLVELGEVDPGRGASDDVSISTECETSKHASCSIYSTLFVSKARYLFVTFRKPYCIN